MGREIQEEQWRSVRRGALLRSMSPVVGLRSPPPPLLPLRRAPHRPDRVAPCGFGGSRLRAYPAKDGGYPTPGSKEGGPVHFRPGGHGGSRIPAILGARRRQSHVSCAAEDAQRHGALRCVHTVALKGREKTLGLEEAGVVTAARTHGFRLSACDRSRRSSVAAFSRRRSPNNAPGHRAAAGSRRRADRW